MEHSDKIFQRLRSILIKHSNYMVVDSDIEGNYYLNTHHVMKNKKPLFFAATKVCKRYVSFHLMPVYVFPELLNTISPELRKKMQGKSCFNFKSVDEALFDELAELTQAGFNFYKKEGYIKLI